MYEAMDVFHKHCAEIEQRIFFATADLFNLDVVFYDTTTASFTLDEADADDDETPQAGLRKFGHPKEAERERQHREQVVKEVSEFQSGNGV
jgi:hypothetical protein